MPKFRIVCNRGNESSRSDSIAHLFACERCAHAIQAEIEL